MLTLVLRAKVLVAEHGPTLVRGLVALAVVAGALAAVTATTTETTRATDRTNVQAVSASVEPSAVVTANDSVYATGTTLTNRSTYFQSVSPTLRLRPRVSVPADREVEVSERLTLVVVASRDGESFYREVRPLARTDRTVTDGTANASARVDVPAVRDRLANLSGQFGAVGTLSATVRYRMRYDTGDYAGRLAASAPLVVREDAYWVDGSLSTARTHSETRSTVVAAESGRETLALVVLAIVSLGTAATVRVYARRDLDRDALLHELHTRQMSEWISNGEIPVWMGLEYVRLESLRDLVDIGIDNNKRTIYDPRRNVYAVIDDAIAYYYAEDADWYDMPASEAPGPAGAGGSAGPPPGSTPGAGADPAPDGDDRASRGEGGEFGMGGVEGGQGEFPGGDGDDQGE